MATEKRQGDQARARFLIWADGYPNVPPALYWSATTLADDPAGTWLVNFSVGGVGTLDKTLPGRVWCVRGPMQEGVY